MEKMRFTLLLTVGVCVAGIITSCTAYKKLPYLTDVAVESAQETLKTTLHEPKIMPNDILSISVNSVKGSVVDFNLPLLPQYSTAVQQTTAYTTSANTMGTLQNYVVDINGNIDFPELGQLKLSGMTRTEAQNYIASLITPRYTPEAVIVNVRFLNFQVSVMGEVARPGTYQSILGQMSVLDAIAAAGDLTVWGRRDNVMLVRTAENGETTFYRIDLQKKDFVNKHEIFYLQQNDKLYVETNRAKGNNAAYGTEQQLGLSAMSVGISAISLVMVIINSTKK